MYLYLRKFIVKYLLQKKKSLVLKPENNNQKIYSNDLQ